MKKKFITAAICFFMLTGICAFSGFAAVEKAVPIQFKKAGGGQFIYCNNPEAVTSADLFSLDNPKATYLMKNEGLKPDNYSVFSAFITLRDSMLRRT